MSTSSSKSPSVSAFGTKYYAGKFTRFSAASYVAQKGVDYSLYQWLTNSK